MVLWFRGGCTCVCVRFGVCVLSSARVCVCVKEAGRGERRGASCVRAHDGCFPALYILSLSGLRST